ncbi:hypothetical protein, partial [Escherichia coli]|uniref:hypothetical protein n=1 Tax=Escherichia coli TaxID=562 RepID=UPI001BDDAD8F
PMPDATLKRLIMPTQRCHICLRRILHKTTHTSLRLPLGGRFFCLSLLEQFSHCRFCDRYLDI